MVETNTHSRVAQPLAGKKIIIGVSGGIAAYKTPELVRRLKDQGAQVRVVMTDGAQRFVTALTFQAVSGMPVGVDLLDEDAEAGMGHIELARWADLILVAPATANLIARLAHGMADDLLTTITLASSAPLFVAPAMNQQMWNNGRTQSNVDRLRTVGIHILGPGLGDQACGDIGPGRLLEPGDITQAIVEHFDEPTSCSSVPLNGLHVLITAGPTEEALDPVRVLTNHSSGKMGYAVATAAHAAGADVTLISGPVHIPMPQGVEGINVKSALHMFDAVHSHIPQTDIFIAVAAVADYRPAEIADEKIKKDADTLTISLVKNPDILASVAAHPDAPFTVGFAAETNQVEKHARQKLHRKKINMIAANHVGQSTGGFGADDNALTLIDANGVQHLPQTTKSKLARQLIQAIAERFHAQHTTQDT